MDARESVQAGLRAVPCPPDVDRVDLAVIEHESHRQESAREAMRAAFRAAGVDQMIEVIEEQAAELIELRAFRDDVAAAIADRGAA